MTLAASELDPEYNTQYALSSSTLEPSRMETWPKQSVLFANHVTNLGVLALETRTSREQGKGGTKKRQEYIQMLRQTFRGSYGELSLTVLTFSLWKVRKVSLGEARDM